MNIQKLIERLENDDQWIDAQSDAIAALDELQDERLKISDLIKAKTEAGGVPDNLAECVEYLMLQEYYPMAGKIDRLTVKLEAAMKEIFEGSSA